MATRRPPGGVRPARARAAAPPPVSAAVREQVLEVHRLLCAEYGCPIGYFHDLDPLSELVSSLLSHRTKNRDSGRAFRQLRAAFPGWTAVRDAPVEAVQAAISPVTWPEQKAPRIQATLGEVAQRLAGTPGEALGDDALDFLADLTVREARDWLESIPGVGPKTSAAVLSFSRLRLAALPVDSHHHRVAVRLGLIPASVDVGPAHAWLEAQLPASWDAQQVYDNHEVLMLHGQHVCHWREPECARCVVLALCPTGRTRLGLVVDAEAQVDVPAAMDAGAGAGDAVPTTAATAAPERALPPESPPPRTTRGRRPTTRSPRPRPQEQLEMSVHPHPEKGPAPARGDHAPQGEHTTDGRAGEISASDHERLASVHADPDQLNAEAREQAAQRNSVTDDVRNAEHYQLSPESRAHGTHGKGFSDEDRQNDEVAVDSGDDPQLRRGGAGRNEAPDPKKFADNAEGHMGGPGWGSESVGGSAVDRRPNDSHA
jgi:endonuclease-3